MITKEMADFMSGPRPAQPAGRAKYAEDALVAIRRIIRSVDIHSRKLLQLSGLTGPQLSALSQIERTEPVCISDLAKSMHLSHATVNDILHRLEKRGLISRGKNTTDKRKMTIMISQEGRRVVRECPSPLHEKLQMEFERLELWEQMMLLASLQRIVSLMEMEKETMDSSPILASGRLSASQESVMSYLDDDETN